MARSLFRWRYRDDAAAAAGLELHRAGALGVDRVVLADAHAVAGVEARAALADDDLAAGHGLAGEHLHAEALRRGVAAVAARAPALLISHPRSPSSSYYAAWTYAASRWM